MRQFMRLGLFAAVVLSGSAVSVRADNPPPVGDISTAAIQAQLRELGGIGWGPAGPGGECHPNVNVTCLDATTVQNIVKELAGSIAGGELTDPGSLALIGRIQGARTTTQATYLELAMYLNEGFIYDFPPPAPDAKKLPIKRLTFPKTFRMNVRSNGEKGTITLTQPEIGWRSSSLRLVVDKIPLEIVLNGMELNLLKSTLSVKAGPLDNLSVWATAAFAGLNPKIDVKRTLIENLALFVLAPWVFL